MPLNIESFRAIAQSTSFSSRDIAVRGEGENARARLGNFVFSQSKAVNTATMKAFKAALEKEYGSLGTHAFDTVVGQRADTLKSLRACDVQKTLSRLETLRKNRVIGEMNRQLDTSPRMMELSKEMSEAVRARLHDNPFKDMVLADLKTDADVAAAAQRRIEKEIEYVTAHPGELDTKGRDVAGSGRVEHEAKSNEATGLRNLKAKFSGGEKSVSDEIKRGFLGAGMRVNRSGTNPVILEKLKSNGVEPGFIYRNDWSTKDTRGFMSDIYSDANRQALESLKAKDPALAEKCAGKGVREQVLLAGRAHPAAMAAAAELLISRAAALALQGPPPGGPEPSDAVKNLAKALRAHFTNDGDLRKLSALDDRPGDKAVLLEAKKYLFSQIRDAVMGVKSGDAEYKMSNVFKHFQDRAIMKLDYNETEKFSSGGAASAGTFMRPERILNTRKPILGQIYRFTSRQSADAISAGAVTEALANDLTRIAGVPAQELEIVRGEYSDGHPKFMLAAKFKNGYQDMEAGMLKDGRVVKPAGADPNLKMESLGKYKAFFLVTADRDGIGKRGQNKGFVNGKFFAIDPGHSLEGNGKYLKVSDDLSFKDTYGKSSKPRFNNFSVFDDDTFFSKMKGVIDLREKVNKGEFKKVFADYLAAFNSGNPGVSPEEKALYNKIVDDIGKKQAEFNESVKKILDAADNNLQLYDDLSDQPEAVREGAIETVSNLEKLTSSTTWVSKKGKVALNHLEVVPETRTPWRAAVMGDKILYRCDKPLSPATWQMLENLARNCGATFETDALGVSRLVVPLDRAEQVFAAFSEENVMKLTHTAEYKARKEGGDGIKEAKIWKPVPYVKPGADPRPLMKAEDLPETLSFEVDGQEYTFPKVHYQDLISTRSSVHRPRNEGELRALLSAQVRRGREVLGALQCGKEKLFEPTHENVVALTYALHAAALKKGEFMYRGSFSIEDKTGAIARWLDRVENIYIRTSTHAKPYQGATVDGHLNMPRGYDVPTGAGGLLNGMRTFHYFTIPDTNHLQDAGGSGPRRRLFLKCETFGIFFSTAHAKVFSKAAAQTSDMKTRGYRFGDLIESICHGSSLFASFFTPKDAPGIRKENLLPQQAAAIKWAQGKLRAKGLDALAERLVAGDVLKGGGFRKLIDNLAWIAENLPEDPDLKEYATDVFDFMFSPFENDRKLNPSGDFIDRMGNEIMIDAKDLL